jgi:uncharacterized protein (DUF952 family)
MMQQLIFKILPSIDWDSAVARGVYRGSALDQKDGFIHFSSATQMHETAAKHFAGQTGLVLVAIDAGGLGKALVWEASRGGALFPHLYGDLDPRVALWAKPLPWTGVAHDFPEL